VKFQHLATILLIWRMLLPGGGPVIERRPAIEEGIALKKRLLKAMVIPEAPAVPGVVLGRERQVRGNVPRHGRKLQGLRHGAQRWCAIRKP
jgi:hypothetical protein